MQQSYSEWVDEWYERLRRMASYHISRSKPNSHLGILDREDLVQGFLQEKGPRMFQETTKGRPDYYVWTSFKHFIHDFHRKHETPQKTVSIEGHIDAVEINPVSTVDLLVGIEKRREEVSPLLRLRPPSSGLDLIAAILLREKVQLAQRVRDAAGMARALEVAEAIWPWNPQTRARRISEDCRTIGEAWDALLSPLEHGHSHARLNATHFKNALGCRSANQWHQWCSRAEAKVARELGEEMTQQLLPGRRVRSHRGSR